MDRKRLEDYVERIYGYAIRNTYSRDEAGELSQEIDALVVKHFAPLMEEYSEAVERFAEGYRKLFPAHLGEDADRMCRGIFEGLYESIIGYAQRTGEIGMPSSGCILDALIQRE